MLTIKYKNRCLDEFFHMNLARSSIILNESPTAIPVDESVHEPKVHFVGGWVIEVRRDYSVLYTAVRSLVFQTPTVRYALISFFYNIRLERCKKKVYIYINLLYALDIFFFFAPRRLCVNTKDAFPTRRGASYIDSYNVHVYVQ